MAEMAVAKLLSPLLDARTVLSLRAASRAWYCALCDEEATNALRDEVRRSVGRAAAHCTSLGPQWRVRSDRPGSLSVLSPIANLCSVSVAVNFDGRFEARLSFLCPNDPSPIGFAVVDLCGASSSFPEGLVLPQEQDQHAAVLLRFLRESAVTSFLGDPAKLSAAYLPKFQASRDRAVQLLTADETGLEFCSEILKDFPVLPLFIGHRQDRPSTLLADARVSRRLSRLAAGLGIGEDDEAVADYNVSIRAFVRLSGPSPLGSALEGQEERGEPFVTRVLCSSDGAAVQLRIAQEALISSPGQWESHGEGDIFRHEFHALILWDTVRDASDIREAHLRMIRRQGTLLSEYTRNLLPLRIAVWDIPEEVQCTDEAVNALAEQRPESRQWLNFVFRSDRSRLPFSKRRCFWASPEFRDFFIEGLRKFWDQLYREEPSFTVHQVEEPPLFEPRPRASASLSFATKRKPFVPRVVQADAPGAKFRFRSHSSSLRTSSKHPEETPTTSGATSPTEIAEDGKAGRNASCTLQ